VTGLESQLKQSVQTLREKEMILNRRKKMLDLGLSIVSQTLPLATLLLTLGVYALIQKGQLTAATIFSTTAWVSSPLPTLPNSLTPLAKNSSSHCAASSTSLRWP
jgi:hypothetical protein